MLDEYQITIQKIKTKNALTVNARTLLGKATYMNSLPDSFFHIDRFKDENYYYFAFTVTMNRFDDEIVINCTLPSVILDNDGARMFISREQIGKMYKNGLLDDLRIKGFEEISLSSTIRAHNLSFKLAKHHSLDDVVEIYELTKNKSIDSFKAVRGV